MALSSSAMTDNRRSSSSSSSDIDVHGNRNTNGHSLYNRTSEEFRDSTNVSEEALSFTRPTHTRRRSGSVHSMSIEEPFTRGEHIFMIGSAALVSVLTVAAITVVLSKAEL